MERKYIQINGNSRYIDIPNSLCFFGVETDEEAERRYFRCHKVVGDNIDLKQMHLYVHYENANGELNRYLVEDMEVEGEEITFSWKFSPNVTKCKGKVRFLICAKKTTDDDTKPVWNTRYATGMVSEGIEATDERIEYNPDVIEQILVRLDNVTEIPQEKVAEAVETYLEKNPLTAEDVGARPDTWTPTAKEVGALPDDTKIPTELPNPKKLKINNGDTVIEYDGSSAVTITLSEENPVRIEKASTDNVVELETGNKYYVFPEMSTLTYTIKGDGEAHFFFKSGATPTEVVHPEGVNIGSFAVEANRIYEVSVMENLLTSQNWEMSV